MIRLNEPYAGEGETAPVAGLTEKVFAKDGWLAALGLEHRPQQLEMAAAAARAFAADKPLLCEAGTGVGKSLAYLVPALMHAAETGRQAVVSTHTIALQEQLEKKDLPLCRKLFAAVAELKEYDDFRAALLAGRGNYLCGTRLAQAMALKAELFPSAEQDELRRLAQWALETKEGLRHELFPLPAPDIWDWVNADSAACNPRQCDPENCFYQKARVRLRQASLIIVNHSLLFSLLGAGAGPAGKVPGVLFPHDFVILDEAHTVPAVATEHTGLHISSYGLNRLLMKLYHPKRRKGLLARHGTASDRRQVEDALKRAEVFFAEVSRNILAAREVVRLREEGWMEASLIPDLRSLRDKVATLADRIEDEPARNEMLDQKERLNAYHNGIQECLRLAGEEQVYWAERMGKRGRGAVLRSAPLDVAPFLRDNLFRRRTSVLLTSATLAEGPAMDSFVAKTGADDAEILITTSPFDYENNLRVFITTDAPAPTKEESRLDWNYLAEMIAGCALRVEGGTMALFTSYRDMRQAAAGIQGALVEAERPFYMQGEDGSRMELLRWFADMSFSNGFNCSPDSRSVEGDGGFWFK